METEREKPDDDIQEEESLKQDSTAEKPVNEDKQTVEQVRELYLQKMPSFFFKYGHLQKKECIFVVR